MIENCIYCGNKSLRVFFQRVDGKNIIKCNNCNLNFLESENIDSENLYDEKYFDKETFESEELKIGYISYASQPDYTFLWQKILIDFLKTDKHKKLLDVGCGLGKLLNLFKDDNLEVFGIDISRYAVEKAKEKGLLTVRQGTMKDIVPESLRFDIITAFDTIEHDANIKDLIENIYKTLSQDGLFIFSTPDCGSDIAKFKGQEWAGYKESLEHVLYLDKEFLTNAMKDIFGREPTLLTIKKGEYRTLIGFVYKNKSLTDFDKSTFLGELLEQVIWATDELHGKEVHISQLLNQIKDLSEKLLEQKSFSEDKIKELVDKYEEQERRYTSTLSEKTGLIENIQRELQVRELELLKREDKIEELIEKYEEQERHYAQEIAKRDESVYFLEGQRYNLENRLNAVLSSKTWKIGQFYGKVIGVESPLRRMKTYFSKKKVNVVNKGSESLPYTPAKGKEDKISAPPFLLIEKTQEYKINSQYDVICLPIIDWFFRYQRPQQILSQFNKNGSRVFYINPKFLSKSNEYFQSKEIRQRIFDIAINADPSLNIYKDSIDEESLNAMMSSLEALKKEMGIVEAVCIVQLPFWQPLAKKIKENFGWKLIYDCMDEHSGFSTNKELMLFNEESLAKECDLLLTTSRSLYEKMEKYNKRCILVPNAADFNHFSYLPPNDFLKEIKKPIIGYYGAISDWFDDELVEYLTANRKDWSFVFIGHTFGSNISKLEKMSNVRFLGEKPYTELPMYLYWFNVCIIPFKLSKLTEATNPVKFYEFISSGKTVVSTELPELLPCSKYLYLAKDKEDFLQKIETALRENDYNLITERIALARANTWEKRYETLSSEIKKIYSMVSIIIVTYNNINYTKLCIESIFSKTQYPNFEIIIVDNNSTDGTKDYLQHLAGNNSDVKIILNNINEGFARANNQGILAASGEYIVFLNNDTIVTRGWLTRLIRHLQDETIGMVGPVTNFCGNEAKIDVPYKTLKEMEEFSEKYIKEHIDSSGFAIKVLALYCVAIKKCLIEEVGLLDEQFEIGMFEDDDYAHRVKLKGYKVVCAEDVFIHHFGEASFKKLKESGEYKRIFKENKRRFEEKWTIIWEPHKHREIKS